MNLSLPHFPGGDAMQFWWIAGISIGITVSMLAYFRRRRWM
jgi:Mg2+ and Co2+ transporter CorA